MPWQHDPQNGEWVMVDAPAPPQPASQPVADGGGYSHSALVYPPSAQPTYDNEDTDARDRWLEENVFSQGWSADLKTGECFDPLTGEVKGRVPTMYRMN